MGLLPLRPPFETAGFLSSKIGNVFCLQQCSHGQWRRVRDTQLSRKFGSGLAQSHLNGLVDDALFEFAAFDDFVSGERAQRQARSAAQSNHGKNKSQPRASPK